MFRSLSRSIYRNRPTVLICGVIRYLNRFFILNCFGVIPRSFLKLFIR